MGSEKVGQAKKGSNLGLIIALMLGYSMVYMDKSMISLAIRPITGQYGLDASQTGLIMSLFFLGYSLMQMPGGWLADKLGAKKVLLLSLGIMSAFAYVFGTVSSLMLFICVRFFAGIGHAGFPSSCSKSVAENFPMEKRTFMQSLMLSTSGIGGILAFSLGAKIIAVNWRYGYFALGTLFLIAFVLTLVFLPEPAAVNNQKQEKTSNFGTLIKNPNILILFAAMLLINFQLYGNMMWLPSYLGDKFGLDTAAIGMLLIPNAIAQTLATIFAGSLVSKLFLGKETKVIIISAILGAILTFCFIMSNNIVLSIAILILSTCVSITIFTTIFTWPHKLFDQKVIGSAIGIVNTGGTLGGFLAPLVLGFLIKSTGSYTVPFSFLAVATVICGSMMLLIKKEK